MTLENVPKKVNMSKKKTSKHYNSKNKALGYQISYKTVSFT